jgi:hypothetical protein
MGNHLLPITMVKPTMAEETKRGCKLIFIRRTSVKPKMKYKKGMWRNGVKNFPLKLCQKINIERMAKIGANLKTR